VHPDPLDGLQHSDHLQTLLQLHEQLRLKLCEKMIDSTSMPFMTMTRQRV